MTPSPAAVEATENLSRRWMFRNLPVATKILGTVATAGAAGVLVGVLALMQMGNIRDAADSIFRDNLLPSQELAKVDGTNSDILAAALRANITQDDAVNTKLIDEIKSLRQEGEASWTTYASTPAPARKSAHGTRTARPTPRS